MAGQRVSESQKKVILLATSFMTRQLHMHGQSDTHTHTQTYYTKIYTKHKLI